MNKFEQQLQAVLEENRRLKTEIQLLKKQLDRQSLPLINKKPDLNQIKSKEKILKNRVNIFRDLFKGREDVYAFRWEFADGTAGYSPSRERKMNAEHTNKNRKLFPLTDRVIYDHLSGKKTIGIYPMLKNETCFFLAVDFDKKKWQDDATTFLDVCKEFKVPASMKRSRSGNGCHIWIFFQEAVPAKLARQLGNFLLARTLEKRYQTGIDSYDRLFPNQDTLPEGGFGNLIALPLQNKPRRNKNSVFIDGNFNAYSDQWHYLSMIKKMNRMDIEKINMNQYRQEKSPIVIHEKRPGEKMPTKLSITLENGIYIAKDTLPSSLIHQIIQLATFNNPAFFKAQAKRFSTYNIPRLINCIEDYHDYLILPRGCMEALIRLFRENSIELLIKDQRYPGTNIAAEFHGQLRAQQEEAIQHMLQHSSGILSATTGFGKTIVAASLIAKRKVNTLVIVHRKQLMVQWKERLAAFLNIHANEIGQIGGGKNKPKHLIDVATIQSLNYKGEVKDVISNYGQIVVDECHHISASSFEKVLKKSAATYVHGLTATPTRRDGLHPIMIMQCGPIRYKTNAKDQAKIRPFNHMLIPRYTKFKSKEKGEQKSIQTLYNELIGDEERMKMIFNDVLEELDQGSSPMLLTERLEHVKKFETMFKGFAKNIVILTGGMSTKDEQTKLEKLKEIPDNQELLVIATGKYIGEGFDNARLDTMFLAMPVAWKGTLQQYVGRLHRLHEDKHVVKVYDYVDHKEARLQNVRI